MDFVVKFPVKGLVKFPVKIRWIFLSSKCNRRDFCRLFATYFTAYPNKLRQHLCQQTSSTKLRQTNSSNNLSATKLRQPDFSDPRIFIQEVILTPGYLVTKNQLKNCSFRKFHCNFILQECWHNKVLLHNTMYSYVVHKTTTSYKVLLRTTQSCKVLSTDLRSFPSFPSLILPYPSLSGMVPFQYQFCKGLSWLWALWCCGFGWYRILLARIVSFGLQVSGTEKSIIQNPLHNLIAQHTHPHVHPHVLLSYMYKDGFQRSGSGAAQAVDLEGIH